ncbi:PLU-1-like protein-domain-containing protein [Lobosporangium transversale]|uniref:[histone H3]-trimethyl-L-lysine(4) demethylase n=1 Tax=Lobosporangium transversale TaxID=64571 RepID=A0A1Y2GRB1_9FUNG|nr:PLU-1-like protein-domain-containing protein [Lobosporangium transversale]ORZ20066.1 PLU-1-like protein-domain-containing protein [Lobosporangium transversale]|eukprot:XP_021882606.1 PLU-1-like protein-domain-containing protein [Lobosporangium transversale]
MMKQTKARAVSVSSHPKSPPLDMTTVATTAPPESSQSSPPSRIFGLQDAPCYYPTPEEFMEPLKFIESIRPEAEKAGICKIIPPEGWKPRFSLDTEVFRFKTRIQKLNSMEGETRTNLNYLEQLYKFHRQQGHPVLKIPQLDKRPIDLFRLRKEVTARGGYQKVTAGKKWAEIGRGLDYTRKQCTSLSNALKSAYLKVILPYEIYLSKQGKTASENFPNDFKRESSSDPTPQSSQDSPAASVIAMPETRKSKRIKKDPVSCADSQPSSPSNSERTSSEPLSVNRGDDDDDSSDVCEICHKECDLDRMLICDGCELGYHTYCLTPPLQNIPKTDWYCAKCLVAGDDFGFEEGEEYSLHSFQQKCNNFKQSWFEKAGFEDGKVPEDTVEREFWRLVENAYETVEVEYGADLHSTQHGSGFPTLEKHPTDKYSAHPANLNNIPVLPESLFCHIKTDISGMMVPWLYVGMCFSTFCWHNEDHYTYSINYMHWGDTKTWYGVPASDALRFEDTMKKAVPELFKQQPDLLFQLVTMLSPERLVANGVKVLALDQRPGQFVVTFPQAYHAGFNHGFNFAEAVNFAPPDWCQFGLECAQRYKEHRKHPVFSHDELILTTALNDTSIATAYWLQDEMRNLLDRELAHRQVVLKKFPTIKTLLEEEDRPEEEIQCVFCNAYIYISQVGCQCTTKVTCHDHINELCKCDIHGRFMRLRYSEEKLREITQRIIDTAAIPDAWIAKYTKIMMETRVPSLRLLRSLINEADKIPFPIAEAARLRKFMAVANEWVEAATKVLVRKHYHQGRRLTDRAQGSTGKRLEDLQEMLRQVERLRFDCPEIKQLQESIEMIQGFLMDAQRALSKPVYDLTECRELYETGVSMNITMDEIDQLETIVTDLTWIERVSAKGVLQEDFLLICSLIEDAERSGVSSSNPLLKDLIKKRKAGIAWEEQANEILSKNPIDLDELQAVIETGRGFPVPRNVLSKAEHLHNKAMEWQKTVEHLITKSAEPKYEDRPLISELKRALKIVDSLPIIMEHKDMFDKQSKKFDDWFAKCQELLLPSSSKKFVGIELEETLEDMKQNVEACTADEKTPIKQAITSNGDTGIATMASDINDVSLDYKNEGRLSSVHGESSRTHILLKENQSQPKKSMESGEMSSMDEDIPATTSRSQSKEHSGPEASSDPEREDQIYCLCRTSESGMMVECDECHEWYHGPCVRVTKREANTKSNYICPICNLSLVIRRDKPRPTLEQLVKILEDARELRFFTPEVPLLESIVNMAMAFKDRVDKFLKKDVIIQENILEVKAYLRKIEGLEIDLREERDALRMHVLRLCPSSMPVPSVVLSTYPTAPELSTIKSQCICNQHASLGPSTVVDIQHEGGEAMIQCGLCNEWNHTICVSLDLEQVPKLTRFICPVCMIIRKKQYPHGLVHYPGEVQARAAARVQAAKDAGDAKKKKRKPSRDAIDPNTGVALPAPSGTEGKKKRPYKKREKTELLKNDEKVSIKRRKSSGAQSIISTVSTDTNGSPTTLPSFSEGFSFPHDSPSTSSHSPQQHSHQHIPPSQRVPSHTLPSYPSVHGLPLQAAPVSSHYHTSSPQQHQYVTSPSLTNGTYRPYQPSAAIQGHAPQHPLSRGPSQSNTYSYPHSHPHSPPPSSHMRSHAHSPPSHEQNSGTHIYGAHSLGSVRQGHYSPSSHDHHHFSSSKNDRCTDILPHPVRDDLYNDRHSRYVHHRSSLPPTAPSHARSYSGYSNNNNGPANSSLPSVLPPMKNHHPASQVHGLVVSSETEAGGGTGGIIIVKDGFLPLETGSGGETETDDDETHPVASTVGP